MKAACTGLLRGCAFSIGARDADDVFDSPNSRGMQIGSAKSAPAPPCF